MQKICRVCFSAERSSFSFSYIIPLLPVTNDVWNWSYSVIQRPNRRNADYTPHTGDDWRLGRYPRISGSPKSPPNPTPNPPEPGYQIASLTAVRLIAAPRRRRPGRLQDHRWHLELRLCLDAQGRRHHWSGHRHPPRLQLGRSGLLLRRRWPHCQVGRLPVHVHRGIPQRRKEPFRIRPFGIRKLCVFGAPAGINALAFSC